MSSTAEQISELREAIRGIGDSVNRALASRVSPNALKLEGKTLAEVVASVSKSNVGLDQVSNYPVATEAEAQAGTVDNRYMTPLRTAQAVAALKAGDSAKLDGKTVSEVVALVTASSVGLGNVANFSVATQAEAEAGTATDKYMTPIRVKQTVAKSKAGDSALLEGKTLAQVVASVTAASVGLDKVKNYDIATQAEAEAGTATDRYMTPQAVAYAIAKQAASATNIDATRLQGKTLSEVVAMAQAGSGVDPSTALEITDALTIHRSAAAAGVLFDLGDSTLTAVDGDYHVYNGSKNAERRIVVSNDGSTLANILTIGYAVPSTDGSTPAFVQRVALDSAGKLTAVKFEGDGSGLTNVAAATATLATSANKLARAMKLSITGDATMDVVFDGSVDVSNSLVLANTGVAAGTYGAVTVDTKGRVTAATVATPVANGGTGATTAPQALVNLGAEALANKGAANGYAPLDANRLIPSAFLPSYVDDVLEWDNLAAFPATGERGKIYVALDTNKQYRWSGSAYVQITSGAVDSVNGKTGIVQIVKADVGLGNVDNTSDANKPVSTATQTALDAKLASSAYTANDVLTKLKGVDGAGSGVDADLLDGQEGAYYLNASNLGTGTLPAARLPASGVTPGTYTSVTVDALGRVTAATTPSTAAGAGLTDVVTTSGNQTIAGTKSFSGEVQLTAINSLRMIQGSYASFWRNDGTNLWLMLTAKDDTLGNYNSLRPFRLGLADGKIAMGHGLQVDGGITGDLTGNVTGNVTGTVSGNAGSATKLATARTIAISGDGTATGSFDGSANLTLAMTLANSGVTAGTYTKVTVDAKGRVTAGAALAVGDLPFTPVQQGGGANQGNSKVYLGWATSGNALRLQIDTTDFGSAFPISATLGASKWTTARTFAVSGDATGSVSLDGSTDATLAMTLANSGVTAGTYAKVTVDAKGRVTAGAGLAATDIPNLDASKLTSGTLAAARLSGTYNIDISGVAGAAGQINAAESRVNKPNTVSSATGRLDAMFTTMAGLTGTAADTDYQDMLLLDTWSDTSGGMLNALVFDKSETKILHFQAAKDATAWGTPRTLAYLDSSITGNAATATKWAAARTLSYTGDATGSMSVDGSGNASAALTLANSGVTAGTYGSVTVDAKGRVTAGSTVTPVANGGTGANNAGGARTNLALDRFQQATNLETRVVNGDSSYYAYLTNQFFGVWDLANNVGKWRVNITNGQMDVGMVPVANGGTSATTAAGARANLGIGSMATRNVTISTAAPSSSDGADGDIWLQYS